MSSNSSSKCCDAITIKGRKCRNYTMISSKWCFQHKKFSSDVVVHTTPVVAFNPIVFSQHDPSQSTCQFRNKFGEFVCKNDKMCTKFCQEHNDKLTPFVLTLRKLLNLTKFYKDNNFTIDSFFKLVKNIVIFFLKHKDLIVSFGLVQIVDNFINMINDNIISLNGTFITNLVIHRNSKEFGFFVNMLFDLRDELLNIRFHVQIDRARNILVSNNIKVNKLTEICLKQNEKLMPVFCKGIDKKILSFIV